MPDSPGLVKLCDFGLAMTVEQIRVRPPSLGGTPQYLSPELYTGAPPSEASDVFSFAMVMYELLTLEAPFDGLDRGTVRDKVMSGERPPLPVVLPRPYLTLIESCWCAAPEKRPSFTEVVSKLQRLSAVPFYR